MYACRGRDRRAASGCCYYLAFVCHVLGRHLLALLGFSLLDVLCSPGIAIECVETDEANRQAEEADRQTDRQTNRQTDRQTDETEIQPLTLLEATIYS